MGRRVGDTRDEYTWDGDVAELQCWGWQETDPNDYDQLKVRGTCAGLGGWVHVARDTWVGQGGVEHVRSRAGVTI